MLVGSYLDTSFLFKFYLTEQESPDALAWLHQYQDPVWISPLSDIELIAAFSRNDSAIAGRKAIDHYLEDLESGLYRKLEMDAAVFENAQNIAQQHAWQYGLRSLDILHLATAVRHGIASFGSFDNRQSDAAEALGLNVFRA